MESQDKDYTTGVAKQLIKTDPFVDAQKLTGKSYKNDEETGKLGFAIQMSKNKALGVVLDRLDDTKFGETAVEYMRKMTGFGFEVVLTIPFEGDYCTENLYVMFHKKYSLLLVFDTYTFTDSDGSFARSNKPVPLPGVNGGHIYFNWSPNDPTSSTAIDVSMSGGYIFDKSNRFPNMYDGEWKEIDQNSLDIPPYKKHSEFKDYEEWEKYDKSVDLAVTKYKFRYVKYGDIDCREAVKLSITEMAHNGVFMRQWKATPFLWLLHYGDTKRETYDCDKITEERIAMLPDYVRKAITPA